MIAVLIVFLAAEKKESDEKKSKRDSDEIETIQRQDSVTVSNTIARKTDKQKNKTGTGHQRDRENRSTTVRTPRKPGT